MTDSFDVVPLDVGSPADAEKLASYASGVLLGTSDIAKDLGEIRRSHVPRPDIESRVDVSTDSDLTTGIRISCADRPGLLYDITSTLTRHGARVRALSVLTFGARASDTFRVVDRLGKPFSNQAEIRMMTSDLRRVCSA